MNFPKEEGRAVLVTGCSSGIGRALVRHLASNGFMVFATVRKESDEASLRGLMKPNVVPVCPLDLTSLDDVSRAASDVGRDLERRGLPGLFALINNAGGGSVAPVELMDIERFRTELEARVLGSVAMVQAFLPMLRKAGGADPLDRDAGCDTHALRDQHPCLRFRRELHRPDARPRAQIAEDPEYHDPLRRNQDGSRGQIRPGAGGILEALAVRSAGFL
jgi:NAD(P)-dependent dehydrogenase (short-subunit alcohol dehydrogenase family)